MKSTCKTVILAFTILTCGMYGPGDAKDWIEKVTIAQDGIDVIPVDVSASIGGYNAIKSTTHRFVMRLYAKATPGERIVAGRVGSYKGVYVFEYNDSSKWWDEQLRNREIGGGESRTVSRPYDVTIKLSLVTWSKHPVEVCAAMLADKKTKGYSAAEVLAKDWDAQTSVYFEFQAVAARAGKAKNDNWNMKNTAGQRDGFYYPVRVRCLAAK